MDRQFDLVLFDLGGVIGELDREAMLKVWKAARLDPGPALAFWRSGYQGDDGDSHPLHRAERGELSLEEFLALAEPVAPGVSHLVDPSRPTAMLRFVRPSESWAELALEIRKSGTRIGALSNAFPGLDSQAMMTHNPTVEKHVVGLFGEDRLESLRLGMRKPNSEVFLVAAQHFDVRPERILFIDDEASNCEGATRAGLTSVHCVPGEEEFAQQQTRHLLRLE